MVFGTERTAAALARLGSPEAAIRGVHVAGTNGKGSVVAFVESVARRAGLRTGAFTSPPLGRLAETLRIDGEPIADGPFAEALGQALAAGPELSLFETLTVAAFVALRDAQVDLALVEAGLGGRLDATNVMPAPLATAIVHVDRDHTAELGDTLTSIARHKAGIGRAAVPMVLGPLGDEALAAARDEACALAASPLVLVREGPANEGYFAFSRSDDGILFTPPPELGGEPVHARLGLRGPHQAANAAVAAALVCLLEPRFPGLRGALAAGLAEARWPGRFELFEVHGRRVVLDGAHNASGARALAEALRALGAAPERCTLVLGIAAEKEPEGMLAALAGVATRRVLTAPVGRRAVPPAALAATLSGSVEEAPVAAFERAIAASSPGDTVIVTGSLYVVGPVRAALVQESAGDGFVFGGRS